MSLLKLIIERLRAEAPTLRRVEGAAELAALDAQGAPHQTPAAWVIPLADDAGANELVGAVSQRLTERFGIVAALREVTDARGEHGAIDMADLAAEVRAALLGWAPDAAREPVEFVRGRLLSLRDGVVWWQDDFRTTTELRAT